MTEGEALDLIVTVPTNDTIEFAITDAHGIEHALIDDGNGGDGNLSKSYRYYKETTLQSCSLEGCRHILRADNPQNFTDIIIPEGQLQVEYQTYSKGFER